MATGLEKVSFHSNPQERQCQRMFKLLHNCTHLTRSKVMLKILHQPTEYTNTSQLLNVSLIFWPRRTGYDPTTKPISVETRAWKEHGPSVAEEQLPREGKAAYSVSLSGAGATNLALWACLIIISTTCSFTISAEAWAHPQVPFIRL